LDNLELEELFGITEKVMKKYYQKYLEENKPGDDFIVWLEKNVIGEG